MELQSAIEWYLSLPASRLKFIKETINQLRRVGMPISAALLLLYQLQNKR